MSLFNSAYSGHRSPTYPLGDPVKYPQQDIPLGTLKLYTEQYISDIGDGVQDILASNLQYTTQEMIVALSLALSYIHNCSDAINAKTGSIGEISLPNMATAILEIPQGGSGIGNEWIITTSTYTVIT